MTPPMAGRAVALMACFLTGAAYAAPTTYEVTTGGDDIAADGILTLREAFTAISTGAAVNEAPAPGTGRPTIRIGALVTVGSALPTLNRHVNILGVGTDARVTASTTGYRFLTVIDPGPGTTAISGLEVYSFITNEEMGGAVFTTQSTPHNCDLSLIECTFKENQVQPNVTGPQLRAEGGAVYVHGLRFVEVIDTWFLGNRAFANEDNDAVGYLARGGALAASGLTRLNVDRCQFYRNRLDVFAGTVGAGAAISLDGSPYRITGTRFEQNQIVGFSVIRPGATVQLGYRNDSEERLMKNCSFYWNESIEEDAGNIDVVAGGNLVIDTCSFEAKADTFETGTGVFLDDFNGSLTNSLVHEYPAIGVFIESEGGAVHHNTITKCGGVGLTAFGHTTLSLVNNIIAQNRTDLVSGDSSPFSESTNNLIGKGEGSGPPSVETPGLPNAGGNYVGSSASPIEPALSRPLALGFGVSVRYPLPCSTYIVDRGLNGYGSVDQLDGSRPFDGDADNNAVADIGAVESRITPTTPLTVLRVSKSGNNQGVSLIKIV